MGKSSDLYSSLADTGSEIMNSINRAVSSGDFSHLNQDISEATSQIQQTVKTAAQQFSESAGSASASNVRDRNVRSVYDIPEMAARFGHRGSGKTPFFQRTVKKSGGTVSTIVGASGLFFWGFPAIFAVGISAAAALVLAVLAGLNGWLLYRGVKIQKLVKRYYQYGDIVGNKPYYDIRALADGTGQTQEDALACLNAMIRNRYFQWAHISQDSRTLFLTQDTYDEYLRVESARSQRTAEEDTARKKPLQADQEPGSEKEEYSREIQQILEQGRNYMLSVQAANDAIPEEGMSRKLDRLQAIMERIFDAVKKDPSSASGLRRFMNYYLPTTDKLLKAYVDLNNQPAGPNVEKTRKDIEDSMDTIISAYEKLLDSMFENLSWDVASDISVMKTMMKQDGLAGDGIRSQNKE